MEDGYTKLAYAILQQAVEDAKLMIEKGIIKKDGTVVSNDEWPKMRCRIQKKLINRKYCGINKPHEVEELLCWLRGAKSKIPLQWILDECGSKLTGDDICKALGI